MYNTAILVISRSIIRSPLIASGCKSPTLVTGFILSAQGPKSHEIPLKGLHIGSHTELDDELHAISDIFHAFHVPMSEEPRPVVMCGPSGSGKSTLLNKLLGEYPQEFGFSVSHTTRKPRAGEKEGKDYHYVSKDTMVKMVGEHEFIEHAEFSGNMYGTSKQAVKDVVKNGQICVLDIDCQGARQMKLIPDISPLYIFISPPSVDLLEKRLRSRGTETEESLAKRLQAVTDELSYSREEGAFDKVIINDQLDIAYEQLRTFLHDDIVKVQAIQSKLQNGEPDGGDGES